MSIVKCLSLIVAMEARNQSDRTKALVADVAIERAKQEGLGLCESMKKPRAYSWYWDKKHTKLSSEVLKQAEVVALRELKSPAITGRYFFNECKAPKRKYKTPNSVIKSERLCFY
jgi:hypothetical protein